MDGREPTKYALSEVAITVLVFLLAACPCTGSAEPVVALAAEESAGTPSRKSAVDSDAAVLATLTTLNEVLARRDLPGFMALFEDNDGILLVGSDAGEVYKGREAVGGFLKALYGLPFTFRFDMPDVTVRRKARHAWLFAEGAMVHKRADGTETRRPYRIALVMKRHGDAWRWQMFSGSVPGPE